jgi:hypothetical protein
MPVHFVIEGRAVLGGEHLPGSRPHRDTLHIATLR